MANIAYDILKEGLLDGTLDLIGDDVAVLLVQETLASDNIVTSADSLSATMSFESSGTSGLPLTQIPTSSIGYEQGGYLLTGKVVSAGTDPFFTADDITISGATFVVGGMLLYTSATPVSAGVPLAYIDYGVNREVANGPFDIKWLQDGIFKLSTKVT